MKAAEQWEVMRILAQALGTGFTDNAIICADGVSGLQGSGVYISDTDVDLNDNLLSNIGGDHRLVKDADEVRTSDGASLADDDTLVTPTLEINTQYLIRGILFVTCGTSTPDIKITFTFPTGVTDVNIHVFAMNDGGAAPTFRTSDVITSSGDTVIIAHAGNGVEVTKFEGSFKIGSTAGTCDLQWAQRISSADHTTVQAGSCMHVLRVT